MTDFAAGYVPDLEDRFLRYVRIDTQSDAMAPGVPSTRKQFDLLNLLKQELEELGARQVRVTDNGFTIATIPPTVDHATPRLAFLAHVGGFLTGLLLIGVFRRSPVRRRRRWA